MAIVASLLCPEDCQALRNRDTGGTPFAEERVSLEYLVTEVTAIHLAAT